MMDGQEEAGTSRYRIADNVGFINLEMIEKPHHVLHHLDGVLVRIGWFAPAATAAQVHGNDLVVSFESGDHWRPLWFDAGREPVDEDDRLTVLRTRDKVVNRHAR